MKKGLIFISSLLMVIMVTMVLGACVGTDVLLPDSEQHAIAFASEEADEEVVTRASAPLNRNFTVYGYKTVSENAHVVFDGYSVTYNSGSAGTSVDNTHNYSYVNGSTQTIKYWDFGASEYNYWAYTGNESDFTTDGTELTISSIEQSVTEPDMPNKMFSSLYHRSPVSTDVVRLEFKRPYTKVRVMFYSGMTLTESAFDNILINDIKFGPASPKQIITKGRLKVSYPKSGEGPETYSTTTTASAVSLSFENVTLDHTYGTASNNAVTAVPTDGLEFYYVVPNNYSTPFTLSANIDGEDKTAVVPANFMNWRPNFVYTYIFKISGGKYMELYDVQIDPWKFGGSQEEDWKNW